MDSVVRGDLQGLPERLPLEQSHHDETGPAGTEAERGRCKVEISERRGAVNSAQTI